jgi:Protein of unknown function DUF262.
MNDQLLDENDTGETYDIPLLKRNIRTQSLDPTIKHLCDRIEKGRLKPQADFQRKYVWQDNAKLKSRLIESVFLEVPIPAIYTAEEDDGSEVVIDGQQRLLTFKSFLKNEFRLSGLTVFPELNHKSYETLGMIGDGSLQERIDYYPLRVIKILKDSDPAVKFDIFERLNRGSVQLNDQELRNCVYRGSFNDFLKKIAKDKDFNTLLGTKEHKRMGDVELALRFFAFFELTYLKYNPPMRHFLNTFMKANQEIDEDNKENFKKTFRKASSLVKAVFGDNAFHLYSNREAKEGEYEPRLNKGLMDVLMYGFTVYEQNQVMPYKDALKEELFWLFTNHDEFYESNTGTWTDRKTKVYSKNSIWLDSLKKIIGSPKTEPRCFSWEIKNRLCKANPVCSICEQKVEAIDDAEVDHKEFYWRGGENHPGECENSP